MWGSSYQASAKSLDEVMQALSPVLDVVFKQRDSSYIGRYFLAETDGTEVRIKLNWYDGDELVHPDLPEGVIVQVSAQDESGLFRDRLDPLSYLEFLRSREVRPPRSHP
jgi:hypothetical protein